MISLPREEALIKWQELWNSAHKEFFKVEALQDYEAEESGQNLSYKLWLEGDKEKSIKLIIDGPNEWAKQCRDKPLDKIRVHIVEEPYTNYIEWELQHYKLSNIPLGGEKVLLTNKKIIPENIYQGDFMMFDDTYVADCRYSPNGLLVGMDFYDGTDDISKFLETKSFLLLNSQAIAV